MAKHMKRLSILVALTAVVWATLFTRIDAQRASLCGWFEHAPTPFFFLAGGEHVFSSIIGQDIRYARAMDLDLVSQYNYEHADMLYGLQPGYYRIFDPVIEYGSDWDFVLNFSRIESVSYCVSASPTPTATRRPATPTPTATRRPATATPTATQIAVATPTPPVPQPVPAPKQPQFVLTQNTAVKSGPGSSFRSIRTAPRGSEFVITAKAIVNNALWWEVYSRQLGRQGWIPDNAGVASGELIAVPDSPLADKINLAGVTSLEPGVCGNVLIFRQPLSAVWQGHVAFAILTDKDSFWGSVDGPGDIYQNNETSEAVYTGFALAKILSDMKRKGYTDFHFVPLRSGCKWDAATRTWQKIKNQKYFVLKLNCADAVKEVVSAFGVKELPPLELLPAPNWWFGSFPKSWRYGQLHDY